MGLVKVLFVCTGNICRSPTAEGVFRALVADQNLSQTILVDSAGTDSYHIGSPPDPRSCEFALKRGIDLSTQRARKAVARDFDDFDIILAMDRGHHAAMARLAPKGKADKLHLFLAFAPQYGQDVPDPYYGGLQGFDHVLDMVEEGSRGLLDHIRRTML